MINNVTLVGRLTRDIEVKYTQSGTAVASFSLAVERNFKNQNGTKECDFINCQIWKKGAEILAQYTQKGSMLGVTGRLQVSNYEDKNGNKVYKTEVVVENFQLLGGKQQGQSQNNGYNQAPFSGQQEAMDMTYQMPSDKDLPF